MNYCLTRKHQYKQKWPYLDLNYLMILNRHLMLATDVAQELQMFFVSVTNKPLNPSLFKCDAR